MEITVLNNSENLVKQIKTDSVESASKKVLSNESLKSSEELLSDLNAAKLKIEEVASEKQTDEAVLSKAEIVISEALLERANQKLRFQKDEDTGKTVIQILDKKTEEVVKQFPPQEFLDMVYNLNKAASVVLKDLPKYV